ncbi:sigma 54-interacting transcriptional regulator [Pseudomonas mucidolens]|uniref:Regulatory protein, Fis family n=1 Tax=Pseudomonas mucidolens TaxID=46679 RepID=A0A1H2NHC7_9PSED|nr:sigma-54 dependent transcriptional regulator [Pseudomonas mucidolens]SDV04601.1 regulatory protein, Fis family [Pseudomonas mucidolens]SQH31963.1 type III secretion system transcriptional regulator RspS [Pseudomonas mucidolens]
MPVSLANDESPAHTSEHADLETTIQTMAARNIDVLLLGETGTGKDTLAERIHRLSGRRGSFVAINCAAIPESLAESQLFGVTNGAFTGAVQSRAGFIEAAHLGTLYLDEIDSMPLPLQAKLLRALESRGVERLGSTKFIAVDMRVIASAQNSLQEMVERGRFRQDLYFRLNVVSINLPPLRERREQIIPLFLKLINHEAKQFKCTAPVPGHSLLQEVLCYSWPGNVRELRSAAKRFILGLPAISSSCEKSKKIKMTLKERLGHIEKTLILDSLRRHSMSVEAAALELCVPRRTLYHRMKQLEIALA